MVSNGLDDARCAPALGLKGCAFEDGHVAFSDLEKYSNNNGLLNYSQAGSDFNRK